MKVIYRSALVNQELAPDSVFRVVPGKAGLDIQKEREDQDFDILFNGNIIDSNTDSVDIDSDADLVLRTKQTKLSFCVKPMVKSLSNEHALAYEKFRYEYFDKPDNEIESIRSGDLKMYAVDQSAEVKDYTALFERMEEASSAFKSICEKPKSHLKAVNEVRPIDTVKRIGYESIPYLAAHNEDWLARTASGLKPARLFSRVEDDEYQIYENRVVKTLIDLIISFLRKEEKELKDQYEQLHGIINSGVQIGSFGFDVSFQKAVSELMVSDGKGHEHRSKALDLVDKLHKEALQLLKKYRKLKSTRLYRYLKKTKAIANPLNETNILLMDKHYSVVFKLWKRFHKDIASQQIAEDKVVGSEFTQDDYMQFCMTLCGYTAHVLNFDIEEDGLYFRGEDNLELSVSDKDGLIHMMLKDRTKRSMSIPSSLAVPIAPGESFETFDFDGSTLHWGNDIDVEAVERFSSKFKTRESRGKEQAEEKKRYIAIKQAVEQRQRGFTLPQKSEVIIYPAVVELENDNRNAFRDYLRTQANRIAETSSANYVVIALPKSNEDEQKITEYAKLDSEKVLILPLTLFDINSFRRIQNVILRQILSFDTQRCPMCGGDLRSVSNQHVCDNCNQLIVTKTRCPEADCRKEYTYLSYDTSEATVHKMKNVDQDNFYQVDSLFQYKDVVPMTIEDGKIWSVCPHCNR